jgi:hypothetical protein
VHQEAALGIADDGLGALLRGNRDRGARHRQPLRIEDLPGNGSGRRLLGTCHGAAEEQRNDEADTQEDFRSV